MASKDMRVLIIGAGIGGLTLANLLERAEVPYVILEKASGFKSLGSAISLNTQVFTFLDQLGIYKDIESVSKIFKNLHVHSLDPNNGKIRKIGTHDDGINFQKRFGYAGRMMARPDLMDALLKRIPKDKILLKKRVVSATQTEAKVTITTADGEQFEGDLAVAGDGCYSALRGAMFQELDKKGKLPESDRKPLETNIECVVGVTKSLDLEKYPALSNELCEFQVMLMKQKNPAVSIWFMPLSNNRLGFMINEIMTPERKAKLAAWHKGTEDSTKDLDWGTEAALEMCQRYKDQPTPYGTKLGDLIDNTPADLISKVLLEEKFYETWHDGGRICLMGDACHKVLPFGAVGATNAMHDALILANLLYDLRSKALQDIQAMLKEYTALRKDYGRQAVEACSGASGLFHNQGRIADWIRTIVLNFVPTFLIRYQIEKAVHYRPTVSFLPPNTNSGSHTPFPHTYSTRYLAEQEAKKKNQTTPSDTIPQAV